MQGRIRTLIEDVEKASSLSEVASLKKLHGRGAYYRIRIGNYRVGIALEEDALIFVRVLHRRDIYRYFP